jgi:hypothetical protein
MCRPYREVTHPKNATSADLCEVIKIAECDTRNDLKPNVARL